MASSAAAAGESSTSESAAREKPIIVRVKRKPSQARPDAFWLEINERPVKKAMLDFSSLSISESSSSCTSAKASEEPRVKKVLVQHVETVHHSEAVEDVLHSLLLAGSNTKERKSKTKEWNDRIKKEKKSDQLRSAARQQHEGRMCLSCNISVYTCDLLQCCACPDWYRFVKDHFIPSESILAMLAPQELLYPVPWSFRLCVLGFHESSATEATFGWVSVYGLGRNARFAQIWRSRKGEKNEADEPLREMCHLYDAVQVDPDGEKHPAEPETITFEEGAVLCNFLPLIREYLPSAAEEIESDIISLVPSEDSEVYDIYTIKEVDDTNMEDASATSYPRLQVDDGEDECYDDDYPYHTAEDNPLFDYPEEPSEDEGDDGNGDDPFGDEEGSDSEYEKEEVEVEEDE